MACYDVEGLGDAAAVFQLPAEVAARTWLARRLVKDQGHVQPLVPFTCHVCWLQLRGAEGLLEAIQEAIPPVCVCPLVQLCVVLLTQEGALGAAAVAHHRG